jgi:type VI secretion system secreted protein VgrG
MASLTQKNRFLAINTVLGADELVLRNVSINEQMSRLFQIDVEMDSQNIGIKFEDIVGTTATVRLTMPNGQTRYFNGIVSRFQQEQHGSVARYRGTLSPWLWLLTRTADCRIFQKQKTPDIIEAIFKDQGFNDYKLKLSGTYSQREFCVQYRETAFNFISRLMEEDGIYYFFQHQDGKHTLILADSPSAHETFPGYDSMNYRPASSSKEDQRESVTDWIIEKEIQSGMYVLNDFNFTTPKSSVTGNANISRTHQKASYEVFDYPGGFLDATGAESLAKVRIQELQAQYEIAHAQCTVRGVAAGYKFTLKGHPRSDQDRVYLALSTSLRAEAGDYTSGNAGGADFFSCTFTAMPVVTQPSLPFRPPRTTPKPLIRGPQTAIVVGTAGQEIDTDQYGRVKVHFHWDRRDKRDENSSCFIRVSQYWAGNEWGSIQLPRIGQEVIVEFLEGDPDRPIITGRVYNADQKVPYALPANKTQSGIKSRSTTGGSADNFNEIRFEDKKGSEELYIHAEKDQNNVVENDETTKIGNNRTETVGKDENITINGARTETVAKDESITINGGRTESVAKDENISISKDRTEDVGGDENISISGGRTESVGKDENISISGGRTESVTKDENISIGGGRTESVGKDETVNITGGRAVTVGKDDNLQVSNNLNIQANSSITFTTGSASITMNSNGSIEIKGSDISIEGSGKIQAKASSDLILKGSSIAGN